MKLLLTVILAGLVSCTHGDNQNRGITDDELKLCFGVVPKNAVKARFPNNVTIDEGNAGKTVTPDTTAGEPYATFYHVLGKLYTVFIIGMDEEGCAEKVLLLWWLGNIPGGTTDDGEEMKPYTPPPPSISKALRCIIVVAEQSGKIAYTGSTLSSAPVVGQLANYLDRINVPDFLSQKGLKATAFTTYKTQKLVPS